MSVSRSYLLGAMHDGTIRPRTLRIAQKEESYVLFLRHLVQAEGGRAWTYREGSNRQVYVVEFARSFLDGHVLRTRRDGIDYARGYFDAKAGFRPASKACSTSISRRKTVTTSRNFAPFSSLSESTVEESTIQVDGSIRGTGGSTCDETRWSDSRRSLALGTRGKARSSGLGSGPRSKEVAHSQSLLFM